MSNEQLQLIERLLNPPGVRALGADIINEREAPIRVESDGDHTICYDCGRKATEFYGYGVRLRPRHSQVFKRRVYLYLCPKRFSRMHCYGRSTTTRLDDWYDASIRRVSSDGNCRRALNDAPPKHQISYDLSRVFLKSQVMSGVEGLNGKAPLVISEV